MNYVINIIRIALCKAALARIDIQSTYIGVYKKKQKKCLWRDKIHWTMYERPAER